MEGGKERRKGREEWKEEGVNEREGGRGRRNNRRKKRDRTGTKLQDNSCHFYFGYRLLKYRYNFLIHLFLILCSWDMVA